METRVLTTKHVCRYGLAYALHRLPAVAAIIATQEYHDFAREVIASHDKANKQAELDVSASMGEMLTDMQACLKQLCGASAVGDAETVAKLIAEKMKSMNSCSAQGSPHDTFEEDLTLPLSASALALTHSPQHAITLPDTPREAKRLKATPIQAPALYDTSGSIRTVAFAWKEWRCGPGEATIADRVSLIKADKSLAVGARNSSLHKKNRHLPQLIEMLVNLGATLLESVRLMTQIADHFDLTLDQMREGARLLNGKAAKPDCTALTAETNVTVGHFRQGIAWAQGEIRKNQQEQSVVAN